MSENLTVYVLHGGDDYYWNRDDREWYGIADATIYVSRPSVPFERRMKPDFAPEWVPLTLGTPIQPPLPEPTAADWRPRVVCAVAARVGDGEPTLSLFESSQMASLFADLLDTAGNEVRRWVRTNEPPHGEDTGWRAVTWFA